MVQQKELRRVQCSEDAMEIHDLIVDSALGLRDGLPPPTA